jgi:cytoskeletal protein RodZ
VSADPAHTSKIQIYIYIYIYIYICIYNILARTSLFYFFFPLLSLLCFSFIQSQEGHSRPSAQSETNTPRASTSAQSETNTPRASTSAQSETNTPRAASTSIAIESSDEDNNPKPAHSYQSQAQQTQAGVSRNKKAMKRDKAPCESAMDEIGTFFKAKAAKLTTAATNPPPPQSTPQTPDEKWALNMLSLMGQMPDVTGKLMLQFKLNRLAENELLKQLRESKE